MITALNSLITLTLVPMLQRGNANQTRLRQELTLKNLVCHSVVDFEVAASHFLSFNVLGGGFVTRARLNGIPTLEHGNESATF